MLAELGDRRLLLAAAAQLGLRVQRLGLGQRDREELVFGREAAGVAVGALQVRTETTGRRDDLAPFRIGADRAGQRQQLQRLFERDGLGRLVVNSDARFGFFFVPSSCSPSCTYGPKRPVNTNTVQPVSGSVPSAPGRPLLGDQLGASSTVSSSGAMSGGSDAVSLLALDVRPVPADAQDELVPVSSVPIAIVLTPRGSTSSSCSSETSSLQAGLCRCRNRRSVAISASPSPQAIGRGRPPSAR